MLPTVSPKSTLSTIACHLQVAHAISKGAHKQFGWLLTLVLPSFSMRQLSRPKVHCGKHASSRRRLYRISKLDMLLSLRSEKSGTRSHPVSQEKDAQHAEAAEERLFKSVSNSL